MQHKVTNEGLRGTAVIERGTRYAYPFLFLLLLVGLAGCGLFSTREPETPSGPQQQSNLALEVDDVFALMESAIVLSDPTSWMNIIDNSFSYSATVSAFPSDPGRFERWDWGDEDDFIRQLLSSSTLPTDSLRSLELEELQRVDYADSSLYRQQYRLELHTTREGLPTVYEGLLDLRVVRGDDNAWRIDRWRDDASGEGATMSLLRATF